MSENYTGVCKSTIWHVENTWQKVKQVTMMFLESILCRARLKQNKILSCYIPQYFQSSSDKGASTLDIPSKSHFWQDLSYQRLHLSAWQFHVSERRTTSDEKWLLPSDFWKLSGESVSGVLACSQSSHSFLFRSYLLCLLTILSFTYLSTPQECSLRIGTTLCHLCLLMSSAGSFKWKKLIKRAELDYNEHSNWHDFRIIWQHSLLNFFPDYTIFSL